MSIINQNIESIRGTAPRSVRVSWSIHYKIIDLLAATSDVLILILASIIFQLIFSVNGNVLEIDKVGHVVFMASILVVTLKAGGLYRAKELLSVRKQLWGVTRAWVLAIVLHAGVVWLLDIRHGVPFGIYPFAFIVLLAMMVERFAIKYVLSRWLSTGRIKLSKVVLVAQDANSADVITGPMLETLGFCVIQKFILPRSEVSCAEIEQLSTHIITVGRNSDIDKIVIEADPNIWPALRRLVQALRVTPVPIVFLPAGDAAEFLSRPSRELGATFCFELQRAPLDWGQRATKRALDIAVAGFLLLLLAPLLIIVAIAIKFDSAGPVVFRQRRCGFNGRCFVIRKFRTMTVMEDGASLAQAQRLDNRVTGLGRLLRTTSIDELPQLLNVLDGSMSLVGPRPHAIAHETHFEKAASNYVFRRRVKPGLTGWAQVNGCRGPTPDISVIERRVEHDLWYADNWSLWLDLVILLRTPFEVLRARNAF